MKKQITIIAPFTVLVTYLALYFQWTEFYKGYSYSSYNLFISLIFLASWLLFSFYWGTKHEKRYAKFIILYWSVNIISALVIWLGANYKFIQEILFLFYIWFEGPLYGLRYIFFKYMPSWVNMSEQSFMLITSPLGILFSYIGYWLGGRVSKIKNRSIAI